MVRSWIVVALLILPTVISAADKPLSAYHAVVIRPFTVSPELAKADVPANYEEVLQKMLFARLLSERTFENVSDASLDPEAAKTTAPATLVISGEVVDYYKGNRAARVIINYGAGAARVKVALVFHDAASGQEVLRVEQEGSYAGFGNLTGGSAEKAKSESARKVVDGLMKKIKAAK